MNNNRSTRIAFLSEHASPVARLGGVDSGGQNVYVDELSRHLAARGYAVDIFTRREDPLNPEIIEWAEGVRVINIEAGPARWCSKDDMWPYMPAFRDGIEDFMLRGQEHYDLLHSNFWMSGWVGIELGQRLGLPTVQIFHATGKTKRRYQQQNDSSPLERIAVEMEIVRRANRIIAQCPNERDELIHDYLAEPEKIATIPAAANVRAFRPVPKLAARQLLGIDPEAFVIVYVGRILPRKDVRNVVQALAYLLKNYDCGGQRVSLLVVGGETEDPNPVVTPELGVLQRLADELGISEQVHFVGKRQQDSLCDYYSAGDVAVTTPWYEPFGLTPLEAMACGRPVIGSAVGGLTYTIKHGETGFLVPPRNPAALAEHCYQLLQDPALKEHLGRAARLRVEQEFTWPIAAMRMEALYESLLLSKQELIPAAGPYTSLDVPFFLPYAGTFDGLPVGGE